MKGRESKGCGWAYMKFFLWGAGVQSVHLCAYVSTESFSLQERRERGKGVDSGNTCCVVTMWKVQQVGLTLHRKQTINKSNQYCI